MNMTKIHTTLRILLLLILAAGVSGAWAQGTVLYSQDYESATDASSWTAPNITPTLITGDATYGKYINLPQGGGSGPRTAYTRFFATGGDFYGSNNKYRIQFDVAFYHAWGDASHSSSNNFLFLYGEGASSPAGNSEYSGSNYLFKLSGGAYNGTTYMVAGDQKNATLADAVWYHYTIDVDKTNRTVKYKITQGSTEILSSSYMAENDANMNAQGIIVVLGRASSYAYIDNIVISDGMCPYTVRSDGGTVLGQGSAFVGSSVSVPVPRFEVRNNSLYEMTNFSGDYYHKVFTVTAENQVETITYNTTSNYNIYYYTEAEDISNANVGGGNSTRVSMGLTGYTNNSTDYKEVTILPAGRYKIKAYATNSNNAAKTVNFKVGDDVVFSFVKEKGVLSEFTSDEFSISDASTLYFAADGSSGGGVDNFYVQATLAFKETGASYILGSGTKDISQRLMNATGASVTYKSNGTSVATINSSGVLTLVSPGRTTITATAGGYSAKYVVTVRATSDATAMINYNATTHIETMTLSGSGNFDEEEMSGQRITFAVGSPDEVQFVDATKGLYCIDDNGRTHASFNSTNGIPIMGTYYAFTPLFSGKLTITGMVTAQYALRLVSEDGTVIERIAKSDVTANTEEAYTFSTKLRVGQTYYVFAETAWASGDKDVTANTATLYLKSFSFDSTQSDEMTILVSDLLYPTVDGGVTSANNRLDRAIPGFNLTFGGGDGTTVYNSDRVTFHQNASGVGQLTITPRLLSGATVGDVVFTGVTLNYSTLSTATSARINDESVEMASGTSSVSHTLAATSSTLIIKYGSDTDNNSFVLTGLTIHYACPGQGNLDEVLDLSKTATNLTFNQREAYISNGHPKAQTGVFVTPSSPQAYTNGDYFNGPLTYSSADPSVATVASDGTVTMLATGYGSQAAISAQFMGTDYFLPSAVATYTVISSVQLTTTGYTIEHVKRGMVVEAVISSDGTTVLDFANTIATSQQVTSADGQLVTTYAFDNSGSNDEFNVVISYVSGANAYVYSARAYYKKPELRLNYVPQAVYNHHGNWTDATLQTRFANNQDVATCFDLEGEPTFTALFEGNDLENEFIGPSAGSTYTISGNIMFVTDPASTPKATVRSTGSGTAITDATVSVPVTMRSTALGYDPTDANNMAVANLPVIPFPYTWDLTSGTFASKTKALELENVTDDSGAYVLLGPGSVAVHGIAIVAGRERPKTNYEIDPSLPNSRLRIPVMAGMKVSVTSYGAERRVTGGGYPLQITNVTDTRGYATATMEILTESNTQDFLAKDDGYVEIYNRSDVNVYITSITVTAPELIFEDGTTPIVSSTATYENRVLNAPTEATLTFEDDDSSNAKIATRNKGTYTFRANATGDVVVTATTGTTAHGIEPCWGQYTLTLQNFYFEPNTITLNHSQSAVSYHANVFLAYAKLYLGGVEWSMLSDEEKAKISFSVAAPSYIDGDTNRPNYAKGIVTEQNNINDPYVMEVRNDGQLIITAVYRDDAGTVSTVKTTCTVNINLTNYSGFKYPAPTVAADESTYTFGATDSQNPLDATTYANTVWFYAYYIGKDSNQELIYGPVSRSATLTLDLATKGSGAYCVVASDANYNPLASFFLTKAYPVTKTQSQSWDFRNGLHNSAGLYWHETNAGGENLFQQNYSDWTQGMPTNRGSDYRYLWAVNGNNGFIIRETAGLLVIADAPTCDRSVTGGIYCDGHFGAYSGDTYNYVYPNIGLHQSTLIIPRLPKGAYVAVAWDRTSDGDGNTVVLENLLDLEGKTIDEIKYGGSVRLTGTNAGNRQGYYTFRVANDGNVTFTQNDKGTSRIVAIHVYYGNPDTSVNASDDVYYNLNATEEFKGSGMTQKLMAYARANEDGSADVGSGLVELDGILTTGGEVTSQWLTNYLNFSAPNGVAEFKMVNQDVTLHNMTMDMSQTYFDSGNGTYAVPGLSFNGACWGKAIMSVGVRDNNGYLVAYRQYRFTVGIRPVMQYPKTWDFTRYFDNVTAKIEDSPITVLNTTAGLNTKNSLATNTGYAKTTISESNGVIDTDPTRTWDTDNTLMRSSGVESYLQYGYNEYSSYYVDDALLVCNLGKRNDSGFILEETRGLGFSIAPDDESDTSKKLQWVMPGGTVGYGENCNLTLNGTVTIAAIGETYKGYYVFLRSSRPPDAYSDNLRKVSSGDYQGIVSNDGQYVFEVRSASDMTMTFNSDTQIYGIGVTNIKKDAMHPVGGMGWATESRDVDIDYTLTDYYTKHALRTYEVKYDSYDLNMATVKLTEVKNTAAQTYDSNTNFKDHGYMPQGTGIVLAETNVSETAAYKVPLFVPAITTTHEVVVSGENMMHPNLVTKEYNQEEEGDFTRFLLTNIHWTFAKDGTLSEEEPDGRKIVETDAAGFYRQHVWTALSATDNAAKNTMAPNSAYLLVPTDQLPIAVWEFQSAPSGVRRNTIAIRFDDITDIKDTRMDADVQNKTGWYTLNGVKLNGQPTKAGLYICNGRKVVVK